MYSSLVTESVNSQTMALDRLSTREILSLINREDHVVADAVALELDKIAKVVDEIASRMSRGGHLIYVGAGTSGRLGVLDASECPPTFSTPPELVQGYIAGGDKALRTAVEGCEDDAQAGHELVRQIDLKSDDCVIGITASGCAKYVIGAVEEAKARGCLTVALVNNTGSALSKITDHSIEPIVGPEVIQGSTRMKAGTAQKMVLNMISTTVMVRLGKVYGNLMVDLHVSNTKLRDRGARIIEQTCSLPYEKAMEILTKAHFNVKEAILMEKTGLGYDESLVVLDRCGGLLSNALAHTKQ